MTPKVGYLKKINKTNKSRLTKKERQFKLLKPDWKMVYLYWPYRNWNKYKIIRCKIVCQQITKCMWNGQLLERHSYQNGLKRKQKILNTPRTSKNWISYKNFPTKNYLGTDNFTYEYYQIYIYICPVQIVYICTHIHLKTITQKFFQKIGNTSEHITPVLAWYQSEKNTSQEEKNADQCLQPNASKPNPVT